jgi:hypothetical protein
MRAEQADRGVFHAATSDFPALRTAAGRLRPWASLVRLWAVQISAHSARTASTPRSRNWRKPRACLICPNTGSTICFLSRYRVRHPARFSLRRMACVSGPPVPRLSSAACLARPVAM